MKLEVIEGDNRIKGLDKLKNEEEYTEAKRNFDYYMSEYEWVSNSKNPKGEIEDELRECNKELHADMEQDEERNLLSKIQTLKTKYIQVARGEYAANIKGNISALLLMLEQYEASNEKRNFYDFALLHSCLYNYSDGLCLIYNYRIFCNVTLYLVALSDMCYTA